MNNHWKYNVYFNERSSADSLSGKGYNNGKYKWIAEKQRTISNSYVWPVPLPDNDT